MGRDYHMLLGLRKDASEDEIMEALKRYSEEKDREVAEVYKAFLNMKRHDTEGCSSKEGLKDNVRSGGHDVPKHQEHKNTPDGSFVAASEGFHDPFATFFGSGGPFGSNFYNGSSAQRGTGEVLVNRATELDVHVTLEEVYSGCTKKVKVRRNVIARGEPTLDEKMFTIEVKPGWKAGTRVTFRHEGNQFHYGSVPGDLVFVIRDKPHPHFRRDGVDVRYMAKITFKEALRGGKVEVPTLTHGKITVPLTDIVTPTTVQRIPGQGLPHSKDPTTRGDLLLSFDIECPRHTTEGERRLLWDALSPFTCPGRTPLLS
uniref:Chaperone DnaJ C-terminal domain-containing protein n=1 Tax=Amblyomma maculatum TaxID=34609 RepID=G3MME3_AMBMU